MVCTCLRSCRPGSYFMQFDLTSFPSNAVFTVQNATNGLANADAVDSDADVAGVTPPTGFLQGGSTELTLDAGYYLPARLGDTVWIDLNRDGDPGNENLMSIGVPGVTIDLFRVDGGATNFYGTTVTSTNATNLGFYEFIDLPPGNYVVSVDRSTVPPILSVATTILTYETTLLSGGFSEVEDFGFIPDPTAIELARMSAVETEGGVLVRWTTAWERDNFGFNVYRSTSMNGLREKVNAQMIGAANSSAGADYSYLDQGLVTAGRYFYWLEDVDFELKSTVHGPARVSYEGNVLASYVTQQAGIVKVLTDDAANVGVKIDGVEVPTIALEDGVVFYAGAADQFVAVVHTAEASRMNMVDAAPESADVVTLSLDVDGRAQLTTEDGKSYFVAGFEAVAIVLDVTVPDQPRLIKATLVELDDQRGVYFEVEGGLNVHAGDVE